MITIKFDITTDNDNYILNKQKNYSYAFRKLYKHSDKISDPKYLDYIKTKFKLSVYELNCLKIDLNMKLNQIQTNKENLEKEILENTKEIERLSKIKNKTIKEIKVQFKLNKKIEQQNKNLSKDITFGSRSLLKQISYLNNNKELNNLKIIEKTNLYRSKRILPINYVGSLNDKNSNRYFDFDFINNSIIYKPESKIKININYNVSKKYKNQLLKLQEIKDLNVLPISVKLTFKSLMVSFDEEILNDYGFNEKEYKMDVKTVESKELKKEIYIKHKTEQNDRKLIGKISNRYCGIDLNPDYIGVTIMDENKIFDRFTYNLSDLLKKSNKSSDDKNSIYLNNKRKYEIGVIYSKLFDLLKHYRIAYFVMEDLNFKSNLDSKEANRKTKNVWNLNFQKNLINKHCNINGIQLIEVNPCYSSFIGNVLFDDFDPANASTEICRRGIIKYIKGNNFYPELTSTILDTVVNKFNEFIPDVQGVKDCKSWIELYKLFKQTEIRYRQQLNSNFNCFSQLNKKCKWNKIVHSNLVFNCF